MELDKDIVAQIKKMAEPIRETLLLEFQKWNTFYKPGMDFFSDDLLLETLPVASYEYLILSWHINPDRIDKDKVVFAINHNSIKHDKDLPHIVTHALRRIASISAHKIHTVYGK